MSLTNDANRMFEWSKKADTNRWENRILTKISPEIGSYFEMREQDELGVYEFDFDSFAELRERIHELWKDETDMSEMEVIATVSIMKHKPDECYKVDAQNREERLDNSKIEIPEYVYNF